MHDHPRSSTRNRRHILEAILMLLSPLIMFSCAEPAAEPTDKDVHSFAQLTSMFKDPPAHFRSAPLWVWNDDMTEAQIDSQLADFKAKGIGGVFVHPRPGLITPYLSDRWNSLFAHTTAKARALAMDVWIYDENSYPSGFAGGHVPAQMPESYNEGGGLKMTTAKRFPAGAGMTYPVVLKKEGETYVDVTADSAAQAGKRGDYVLFEKLHFDKGPWYGGHSYVDILRKGVTEKFLEVTMAAYESAAREEFGKTVPGIFSDEPHVSMWGGIRWTPDLFSQFQQRWGYDLRPQLPSLWDDVGDWRRVRHNYYAVILDLFIERWSKPYFEYCEKHNLAWTGHYWEHAWPSPVLGPDNMGMYAWHHMPGIDVLMNQYSERTDAQFGNVRAAKELISAASQVGRKRTLSETYGAGGWDMRFEDMKRIADWQYVLGVNFVNQHLSYVTIKGARKRDHPQSFSYHEPWWDFYTVLGDYCGRMSLATSAGEQINRILVLEPTTTAWVRFAMNQKGNAFGEFGQKFQDFVTLLEKSQIEYDLGSESIIQFHGKVEGGTFTVGKRTYDLVVIPAQTDNLNARTAELIEQYVQGGGNVLCFGEVPSLIDGSTSDRMSRLASSMSDRWVRADSVGDPNIMALLSPKDFRVIDPAGIAGLLYHHRRKLDDGQILLLTNTSLEQWSAGSLEIAGKSARMLNAMDGGITPYPAKLENGKLSLQFNLPPAGELLLYVSDSEASAAEVGPQAEPVVVPASTPMVVQRTSPNALALDYCDLALSHGPGKKETTLKDIYFFKAADTLFKHFGLSGNPWANAVQFKREILDKDTFPEGKGFKATYYLQVGKGTERTGMRAVVERPGLWQLLVNGSPVEPLPGHYWLDREFGVYDIGEKIVEGMNTLTLAASRMTIHSELEAIYILGDFGLEKQRRGWKLVAATAPQPGAWSEQGMPFYSSAVSYSKSYQVARDGGRYAVQLPEWLGTVAEVRVNGKKAGIVGWQPYRLDVTDALADGDNEVSVLVYGSLKNLLGPHHRNPPLGAAWPGQFQDGPAHQPPGAEYSVVGYGLRGAFELVKEGGNAPPAPLAGM